MWVDRNLENLSPGQSPTLAESHFGCTKSTLSGEKQNFKSSVAPSQVNDRVCSTHHTQHTECTLDRALRGRQSSEKTEVQRHSSTERLGEQRTSQAALPFLRVIPRHTTAFTHTGVGQMKQCTTSHTHTESVNFPRRPKFFSIFPPTYSFSKRSM